MNKDYIKKSTAALTAQALLDRNARWDELNELLDRDREEYEREIASHAALNIDVLEAEAEEEEIIYQLECWGRA